MLVTIITCVGLVGTLLIGARAQRASRAAGTPLAPATIAWGVVFALFQLFIVVWSGIGLVEDEPVSAIVFNVVMCACAYASFSRPALQKRLRALTDPQGAFPHPVVAAVIALVLAGIFATLGLEVPSNHNLLWMYPLCLLLEVALVTALLAGTFFLLQRRAGLAGIFAFALFLVGIAEYFVITFKSMPITPGDLTAISTAAAVAGTGYTYTLSAYCLVGMALMGISLVCLQTAALICPEAARHGRRALVTNLVVALVCLGGLTAHVTLIDYYHTLTLQVYTWRPLESYYRQGFLPAFISGAQTIKPPRPDDYSTEDAEALIADYADRYDAGAGTSDERTAAAAQFDEEQPTVIAIMNETFSDLSIYQQMHANYEGPEYFKSISDCVSRGRLYVSAYGGGTANTEFEFLTGNSMANLGSGVYPYTIYNLMDTENLAAQFKDLGYDTTAMHPNHATNWNRENVYEDFGFDQFLAIEDFQDAETLRGMVTDRATYDKILELLDENENPQFIFDVTMQNHSGYNTGLVPADKQLDLSIDGMYDGEVNEYVSLIQESDRALEYFIDQLSQLDRKVVVVFFGDHQPFFPSTYNDLWFTDDDPAAHQMRLWQTDYIIWANYDVAGNDQVSEVDDLSTNYLAAELMNLIGAPMSDYQKAQIVLREAMPAINSSGYEDAAGTWFLTGSVSDDEDTSPVEQARADYAVMQYYEMFYDGKEIYTKRYQSAANETDPNLTPGTTKIK